MCGIAGFCDWSQDFTRRQEELLKIGKRMGETLVCRGPDASGEQLERHAVLAHRRLIVIDPDGGIQPMTAAAGEAGEYVLVYNGELYNTGELQQQLLQKGQTLSTRSDTEVVLRMYMAFGEDCVHHFNGIFAFAIYDPVKEQLFLARDRCGVKPLFYTGKGGALAFGSEIKALFQCPGVQPVLDESGVCEIFGLGPARSPGCGVFRDIHEIPPGWRAVCGAGGLHLDCYWQPKAEPHREKYLDTVEHTRMILFDAIRRQLVSDVPLCTLLSGGLDSSVVSAVASGYLHGREKQLDTYSFDYVDNDKYFQASAFQPEQDRPYVDKMVEHIHTRHHYLVCNSQQLYDALFDAVAAKDLPGMTDVDSSLYCFSGQIRKNHTVCLSGECADEIFGGYPWFRDERSYTVDAFPWSRDLGFRREMLRQELRQSLPLEEYVQARFDQTLERADRLEGETPRRVRERQIALLNTSWFMTTLLDRKDRMTMAHGLEVRVPFADHRLVEYLYNVPWEMKFHNGEVKGLLKDVARGLLPDAVLSRKKSPYPKSYNPWYEQLLRKKLSFLLADADAPLWQLCGREGPRRLLEEQSDTGRPWFGQLMASPQMMAYLIQIDDWLRRYHVRVCL